MSVFGLVGNAIRAHLHLYHKRAVASFELVDVLARQPIMRSGGAKIRLGSSDRFVLFKRFGAILTRASPMVDVSRIAREAPMFRALCINMLRVVAWLGCGGCRRRLLQLHRDAKDGELISLTTRRAVQKTMLARPLLACAAQLSQEWVGPWRWLAPHPPLLARLVARRHPRWNVPCLSPTQSVGHSHVLSLIESMAGRFQHIVSVG